MSEPGMDRSSARARWLRPDYGRDFYLYVAGQAVSLVGDRIATIALVFLVIELSQSFAPALAVFYISRALPTLLGGLLVGVLADQFDRRHLMIGCDLSRMVLVALVPALSAFQLWALYPVVILLFALTLVFNTAARAALPDVVPEEQMLGANAVLNAVQTSADVAYAFGGILVVALSREVPFYIDAATFLFSAVMIFGMQIPRPARSPLPHLREIWERIAQGIQFLLAQPFLRRSTFALAIAPIAGGAAYVLAPLYANDVLRQSSGLVGPFEGGAFRFSVLEVSLGVGALAGSLLVSRLASRMPRATIFAVGLTGSGVADAALSLTQNLYVAATLMAISGAFTSLFGITGVTLLQTLTPTEMRGRVVAARFTVINTALAVGSAIGGAVLLAVSYRAAWVIEGGVIVAASLFLWLRPEVLKQP